MQPAVSDTARRWITAALLIGTFLSSIEVMIVGPAMPAVVTEFGGAGLYPFVFTTYIGAQTLTMPLYGLMADRWGRRDAFMLGVTLFLAGSIISAAAPSMAVVIAGRLVQGLGAGAILPLTMTIFGDLYPVAARTKMQGWFSLIWGVSSLIGPAVGGALTEALSWRAVFWLNLPPGLIAAALIGVLLPRRLGATTERRVGLLESLPILLRNPTIQAVSLSGFALGVALFGVVGYLPVRVQAVEGGTALDAGLALIPMSVAWTISANVAGRLVNRTGFRTLVRVGAALTAVGTLIAGVWTANLFGLVLFGAGMGLLISSFTVASQVAAPEGLIGQATSLGLFTRSVGGAIGLPALGLLAGMSPGVTDFAGITDLPEGLRQVFLAVAVSGVIAALIVVVRFPVQKTTSRATPPAD